MKIIKNVKKIKAGMKTSKKTSTFRGGPFSRENRPRPAVINDDYQTEEGGFKKGNPGRPPGIPNKRTVFMNRMMDAFGDEEARTFKKLLKKPNRVFLQALDRIVTVAGISGKSSDAGQDALPPYEIIIEGQDAKPVAIKEEPRKDIS